MLHQLSSIRVGQINDHRLKWSSELSGGNGKSKLPIDLVLWVFQGSCQVELLQGGHCGCRTGGLGRLQSAERSCYLKKILCWAIVQNSSSSGEVTRILSKGGRHSAGQEHQFSLPRCLHVPRACKKGGRQDCFFAAWGCGD